MSPSKASGSAPKGDTWQADIQEIWTQGQRKQAIDQLLERINAQLPHRPRALVLQFGYYLWQLGDVRSAEQVLRQLQEQYPDDAEVVENLGVMLSRLRRYAEAVACFERAAELRPGSANAWDGLAHAYAVLGDHDHARQAGERSLELKTEASRPLQRWCVPPVSPEAFLTTRPDHHVIAFSLWGGNPRYLRGVLRNLLLIPDLYPGWTARLYVDDTVPQEFVVTARQLGADVVVMPSGQSLRERLCWRFLVANDPGVGRFLVRDTDSVVNLRERHAVEQWLASDRWFHVMRDWWTHTDPVLAGMWGGIAGVLPDLKALLKAYRPPSRETANVDQWFLRDVIWGSLRPHALIHDRCFRSAGSQPWPDPAPAGNAHVGQDEYTANHQHQAMLLQGWIAAHPWLGSLQNGPRPQSPTASRSLRSHDLRQLRCRWISLERDGAAVRHLEQSLRQQGFQDLGWCPGVRLDGRDLHRERMHARAVALAHRQALERHLDEAPLLLLEDDVALEADADWQLAVPEDADAVWVGISRYGKPLVRRVTDQLSRIERMFSAHAVLYLSRRYKEHVIQCVDQCNDCWLPFDVGLSFYQRDFHVYALNRPLFYQVDGNGQHAFEALTRGPLLAAAPPH